MKEIYIFVETKPTTNTSEAQLMTNSGCPSTAMLGVTPRPGPSGSVILPSFLTAPATVPVLT